MDYFFEKHTSFSTLCACSIGIKDQWALKKDSSSIIYTSSPPLFNRVNVKRVFVYFQNLKFVFSLYMGMCRFYHLFTVFSDHLLSCGTDLSFFCVSTLGQYGFAYSCFKAFHRIPKNYLLHSCSELISVNIIRLSVVGGHLADIGRVAWIWFLHQSTVVFRD